MTRDTASSLDISGFLPLVLLTKDGRQVLLHDETAVQAVLEYADDRVQKAIAAYAEMVAQDTARMNALQSVMTVLRCNPYDDDLYIYIGLPIGVQMSDDLRVLADNLIAAMPKHDPETIP